MPTNTLHALVVDDDPQVGDLVSDVLRADGWLVSQAESVREAIDRSSEREWPLVFCDVMLGDGSGYDVLREFTTTQPKSRFVVMTGHGSAAGALDATATGAFEYLLKPFRVDDVLAISRVTREQAARQKTIKSQPEAEGYRSDLPLIGSSRKFVECMKLVGRVSGTDLPILITGESGSGKEVVARAVHLRSGRKDGPFVTVNCGALPDELIESELFGHAKGAFTGADRERIGLWEMATGGTLFLDEITETSPRFQVKLLRALQEGEIRRVGSNRTIRVDVRVIAATNRDIDNEVRDGRFRQDLMFRLNTVMIELPPLRERAEDVPLLVAHFAGQMGTKKVQFSKEAMELLQKYDWPGNVRELENAVQHAVSIGDSLVYPEQLPPRIREYSPANHRASRKQGSEAQELTSLHVMERRYVERVLEHTGGNKLAAAKILDIDRKTLGRILARGGED
ncbi:MAG: sigma-54-dependent Fis family transcriptional regulator [Acidobacteria bacterium]|nr:sigma-54-dependent Fis family transcriptional regulator [Acidobacteriota bacterium]